MFYIIEIQEGIDGVGTIVNPIQSAEDIDHAKSKYHAILQYAAISSVFRHTCLVIDGRGEYFARETYTHPPVEEPIGGEEE